MFKSIKSVLQYILFALWFLLSIPKWIFSIPERLRTKLIWWIIKMEDPTEQRKFFGDDDYEKFDE